MEIRRHQQQQFDRVNRKVQVEKALARIKAKEGGEQNVQTATGAFTSEKVDRYVSMLKEMDPTDLHRVEELRQKIENGEYTAEVDDLVEPLLRFLGSAEGEGAV